MKQELETLHILDLVISERRFQPRIGGKKLYHLLSGQLRSDEIKMGRDKFLDFLSAHDLLIRRKRNYARTTNSYHRFHRYKNLLLSHPIEGVNRVWAADITYLRTERGFVYLSLLTDMYSRKIVGWELSESLSIEGSEKALCMAFKGCVNPSGLIHHSDRGIQYCSNSYVKRLLKKGVRISMTEENHCYENALAERVNGILKDEYLLDSTFKDYGMARRACKEAIRLYNERRPHWSLNLRTPDEVHHVA